MLRLSSLLKQVVSAPIPQTQVRVGGRGDLVLSHREGEDESMTVDLGICDGVEKNFIFGLAPR